MKLKFENPSVSGISRIYPGFRLYIPGHAIGNKSVILDVPDEFVENVKEYLKNSAPVIKITGVTEEVQETAATTSDTTVVDINIDDQAPEPAEEVTKVEEPAEVVAEVVTEEVAKVEEPAAPVRNFGKHARKGGK